MYKIIRTIKRWIFLKRLNRAIKPHGAQAVFFAKSNNIYGVDTLQLNMGNDFTHTCVAPDDYNKKIIEYIINQVIAQKTRINNGN